MTHSALQAYNIHMKLCLLKRGAMMRHNILLKRISLLLAASMLLAALCACSCAGQVDGEIHPTQSAGAEPTAQAGADATETADASDNPNYTQNPNATPSADVTPSASVAPTVSDTPSASTVAGGTPTPTPVGITQNPNQPQVTPTPTPIPDPAVGMTWFDDSSPVWCDMDFDGHTEKIEIELVRLYSYTYTCYVRVTVGATGNTLSASFVTESFSSALLNNFNTGDGRVELLVCCSRGATEFSIHSYRLNANSDGFESAYTDGWIESAADNTVVVGRYQNILGTWACTASFAFSTAVFNLVQTGAEWTVYNDADRWCTVSQDMLVEFFVASGSDNVAGFIYVGERLFPTSTDMRTYIQFSLEDGRAGSITITLDAYGNILINSQNPNNWFSDLEYLD